MKIVICDGCGYASGQIGGWMVRGSGSRQKHACSVKCQKEVAAKEPDADEWRMMPEHATSTMLTKGRP